MDLKGLAFHHSLLNVWLIFLENLVFASQRRSILYSVIRYCFRVPSALVFVMGKCLIMQEEKQRKFLEESVDFYEICLNI